jgi:hypothetical protein
MLTIATMVHAIIEADIHLQRAYEMPSSADASDLVDRLWIAAVTTRV